jgi:hypothetical protein
MASCDLSFWGPPSELDYCAHGVNMDHWTWIASNSELYQTKDFNTQQRTAKNLGKAI